MTNKKSAIVEGIDISRKNIIEVIVVAILLAFSVNLIADQIQALAILSSLTISGIGVLLCIICVLYLISRLFCCENQTCKGFFVYSNEKNEIIPVPRYCFSERLYEYLYGAFVENPALKAIWDREPLREIVGDRNQKSAKFISEAIEYFVLNLLSTHLEDYFAGESFEKENLEVYQRDDIPDILLKNRFLELFSHPRVDRQAFVEDTFGETETGEVLCAYNPSGAIYEKFELVLPKGSSVERLGDNTVQIETKKLKITLTVRFEGNNTVLPYEFDRYYLDIQNRFEDINPFEVEVDIRILIKFRALFTVIGWGYYGWVDSFLSQIEKDLSKDAFFGRIGWESASSLIQYLERKQAKEDMQKNVPSLHQEINQTSLTTYLREKFPDRSHSGPGNVSQLVRELSEAGYKLLKDVDDMIEKSKDAFTLYEKENCKRQNYFDDVGIVRISAEISDEKYRDFIYRGILQDLKKEGTEFAPPDLTKYEQLVKE